MIGIAGEVGAEARLPAAEGIVDAVPVGGRQPLHVVPVGIDAHRPRAADCEAVARRGGPFVRPGSPAQQRSLRILRVLADHAVDRVRPVKRPAGSADHFDLLKVLDDGPVQVPQHRRSQRRIDRPAVDQGEHLVPRLQPVEAAGADRILRRVDLLHVKVRCQPQHFRERSRARRVDVVRSNHVKRGRSARQRLLALGRGAHPDLRELLDRKVGKVLRAGRRRLLRKRRRSCRHADPYAQGRNGRTQPRTHAVPSAKTPAAAIPT
jgi:hypothetical protein